MRAAFAQRAARRRAGSIQTVPPTSSSDQYSSDLASIAASILYRTPVPGPSGLPLYILNGAAFPEASDVDYTRLLPYVLARLPNEDDLLSGTGYEIIFFAGGQPETLTSERRDGPGMGWYLQAYNVLSRATRKRLQKMYIVHERSWVRVLIEVLGTIVSPKFRKKIVHLGSLAALSQHLQIESLLIPPSVYLHDSRPDQDVSSPVSRGQAFGSTTPLPTDAAGQVRLPRVLRETTMFICQGNNLDTEGIFRISAHSRLLGVLRDAYDRGQRFVVWKEQNTAFVDPGMTTLMLSEIADVDTYGVVLATGLIKTWYRELHQPIFPESCYPLLKSLNKAQTESIVDLTTLIALFSPTSTDSPLSQSSRLVLTWHLLPLCALVCQRQHTNKMTPDNLAICFAPALVNGTDAMIDAKVFPVVRRLLRDAITTWPQGLCDACGRSDADLYTVIQGPPDERLYQDLDTFTMHANRSSPTKSSVQVVIHPDDTRYTIDSLVPPPLPARSSSLQVRLPIPPPVPRRKPAPRPSSSSSHRSLSPASANSAPEPLQSPSSITSPTSPAMVTPTPLISKEDVARNMLSTRVAYLTAHTDANRKRTDSSSSTTSDPIIELKRKPVNSNAATSPIATVTSEATNDGKGPSRSGSGNGPGPSLAEIQSQATQLRSVSGDSTRSDDGVFVKPTWAASERKASITSISSTCSATHRGASPVVLVVPKHSSTPAGALAASTASHVSTATSTNTDINTLAPGSRKNSLSTRPDSAIASSGPISTAAPYIGRPRAPSPGLLQRMQSWDIGLDSSAQIIGQTNGHANELTNGHTSGQNEGEVVLGDHTKAAISTIKTQSVEDIKRLYEERLATAGALSLAARKSSGNG